MGRRRSSRVARGSNITSLKCPRISLGVHYCLREASDCVQNLVLRDENLRDPNDMATMPLCNDSMTRCIKCSNSITPFPNQPLTTPIQFYQESGGLDAKARQAQPYSVLVKCNNRTRSFGYLSGSHLLLLCTKICYTTGQDFSFFVSRRADVNNKLWGGVSGKRSRFRLIYLGQELRREKTSVER